MQKGSKVTDEVRKKISIAKKLNPSRHWEGKKFSEEHKKKLSLAKLGKPGNNKTTGRIPWNKGKKFDGTRHWNKGKKFTDEHRKKLSEARQGKYIGEENNLWKGGITGERTIRGRVSYKKWRAACLERDGHMCKTCESQENLIIHHIKNWETHPELRLDVENGITLCQRCHVKCHWLIKDLEVSCQALRTV